MQGPVTPRNPLRAPLGAKLAFLHRTLWRRNPLYRWAALLGPPPLLGAALAGLGWTMLAGIPHHAPRDAAHGAPWAQVVQPVPQNSQDLAVKPALPLPPGDGRGGFAGHAPGWLGEIHGMSLDAVMEADVHAPIVAAFEADQLAVPLSRIVDAAPPDGLFVGVVNAYLTVRTPGPYGLSMRIARSGAQSAHCLARLGVAGHRLVRNINLNVAGDAILDYPLTEMRLEPGLYGVAMAAGCWRGAQMNGGGVASLMIRHPGEAALQPARVDDVIRPVMR